MTWASANPYAILDVEETHDSLVDADSVTGEGTSMEIRARQASAGACKSHGEVPVSGWGLDGRSEAVRAALLLGPSARIWRRRNRRRGEGAKVAYVLFLQYYFR